jgi:peroxidase
MSRCTNFRDRIYDEANTNAVFATLRRAGCPAAAGDGDGNLAPLDAATADAFDNAYYTNLLTRSGLLHSDQELFNGGATDGLVRAYASTPARFTGTSPPPWSGWGTSARSPARKARSGSPAPG